MAMNFSQLSLPVRDHVKDLERECFFALNRNQFGWQAGAFPRWAPHFVPPLAALHFRLSVRFRDLLGIPATTSAGIQ